MHHSWVEVVSTRVCVCVSLALGYLVWHVSQALTALGPPPAKTQTVDPSELQHLVGGWDGYYVVLVSERAQ